MKKRFAALFINGCMAGGLFVMNLAPAQATVFLCEEVARYGVTSNGTTVYDNFVVYSC